MTEDITYSLATSPTFEQDKIAFAARGSGLYRSDDGLEWRSVYDTLNLAGPLPTTAVVVSPDFKSDPSVLVGVTGGVLRSRDGGQSWQFAVLPSPPPVISSLVISPDYLHDGILLAGTLEDGVFRSGDRGVRWAAWNFGLLDLNVFCLAISPDFAKDETVFAGTETGIFVSSNGGRAWREMAFPTESAPILSLALSPGFAEDGILFAGTESAGLFQSSDQGHTWQRLGESVITGSVNGIVVSPQFPDEPHLLVLLDDAVLATYDGGCTWSPWKPGVTFESAAYCIAAPQGIKPGSPLLIGLTEGGILRL